jgi:hypothetical protein
MLGKKGMAAYVGLAGMALLCAVAGCGTTRTSNTLRTATEQLLISDAIDQAVQAIDFHPLAGKTVFFDDRHLYDVVDDAYLISSLRQHLLASGCILKETREEATYVIEPRAGAIGTDNQDWLFGMPATNVPQLTLLAALPPVIPEIPIAKRRNQRGVAKIAVFAYHRETGEPAWQSGIAMSESTANDIWVLGAGPFKRGTIRQGTSIAGTQLTGEEEKGNQPGRAKVVQVTEEAIFKPTKDQAIAGGSGKIQQASAEQDAAEDPVAQTSPVPDEAVEGAGPPVFPPPPVAAASSNKATITQ